MLARETSFGWNAARLSVDTVDADKRICRVHVPCSKVSRRLFTWWAKRYYVENAFEALDQPGEWYLNRRTGRLYYKPRQGEKIDQIRAVATRAR